jgi:hypothetical protein
VLDKVTRCLSDVSCFDIQKGPERHIKLWGC